MNWSSVTDGGTGPTNWAVLLSVGNWTSNAAYSAWTLAVSPAGTNLVMEAQASGSNQVVFSAPIDFDAGDWHYITITYSPSNSWLYLEGQPVCSNGPILYQPSLTDCTNYGFFVGSLSTAGVDVLQGQMQWLATYSYALSSNEVSDAYSAQSAYITYWGGSLPPIGFGGGGSHSDADPPPPGGTNVSTNYSGGGYGDTNGFTPPAPISQTNYADYMMSYLTITNSGGYAHIAIQNCLSNLTYVVYTNSDLSNSNGWAAWQTNIATNSIIIMPAIEDATNALFFTSALVLFTGTNSVPDYWCMQYFGTLNVNPFADPDGDGLCNYDEYMLGSNPTNAHSISPTHKDAQALFLAYTNDAYCSNQLSVAQTGTNTLIVAMWPLKVGTNYQIYSQTLGTTNGPWQVEASFVATNSTNLVVVTLNGRSLALIGGYAEDDDGDGLPTAYEVLSTLTDPFLPDTGQMGTLDGYKDPDGDGWVNLQEYQNGTDPHVFNPPPPASGVTLTQNTNGTVTITWANAGGTVAGYVIYQNGNPIATNSASATSYTASESPYTLGYSDSYQVQVLLAAGASQVSAPAYNYYNPRYLTQVTFANGKSNQLYLVACSIPPGVTKFLVNYSMPVQPVYPQDPWMGQPWGQIALTNGSFTVPVSAFTNGIAVISPTNVPWYGAYSFEVALSDDALRTGEIIDCQGVYSDGLVPFVDATAQMKANEEFLLQVAVDEPFHPMCSLVPGEGQIIYPPDYVFSSYYSVGVCEYLYYFGRLRNPFMPFEDNFFYRNYVFSSSDVSSLSTCLATGVTNYTGYPDEHSTNYYLKYTFPTYSYLLNSNLASVPNLLGSTSTNYVWAGNLDLAGYPGALNGEYVINDLASGYWDSGVFSSLGITASGSNLSMTTGGANAYGLPYTSFLCPTSSSPPEFSLLTIGGGSAAAADDCYFYQLTQPALQTVGYYFGRFQVGYGDPLPGDYTMVGLGDYRFNPGITTPIMIAPEGASLAIAGYAKQQVTNGNAGLYGYLGQYFDGAYLVTNGVMSSNSGGILSEYGDFLATLPGRIELLTKPDATQSNLQGQCFIDVISLETDANHDGILDPILTGPDFTTSYRPFRFWINDDYDNGDDSGDGIPGQTASRSDGQRVVDNSIGYEIHGTRDLIDYFPVYLNLGSLPQESLTNPVYTNLTFALSQGDDALRFAYTSLTATNFRDYLLNTNVAESLAYAQTFEISTNGTELTGTFIQQMATNNGGVILVDAWTNATQPLVLSVYQNGNLLAQTSLYLSITGVEQMFRNKNFTASVPPFAPDGMPDRLADSDVPNEPDTDSNNFVFLHGYNVTGQSARGNFSDVFKRLFWSGSHAKFYGVNWKSDTSLGDFAGLPITPNFHTNVVNAFTTASNLAAFLGTLSGTNVLAAHSLGNMLALSTISDWNAPISQYYMIDAAVAIEDLDAAAPQTNDMILSKWLPYASRLFAHEWYKLFATNDARNTLTWSGRFSNLQNVDVFNFYSSGEEILRDYPNDPPTSVLSGIPSQVWSTVHGIQGSYVWVWQEKAKGLSAGNRPIGSNHGGWSFNLLNYESSTNSPLTPISPATAAALSDSALRSAPFFNLVSSSLSQQFTNDIALVETNGSAYAQANRNRILSDSIPALTLPIGANSVPSFNGDDRNFDMKSLYENGWPADRLSSGETNNWHHSDYREVAYTFTYKFYTNLVIVGNLK